MEERQVIHLLDDEPLTEEDLAAIREGLAEKARGEVVSHEKAERLLIGRPS